MEANKALAATLGPKVKETAQLSNDFIENDIGLLLKEDFTLPLDTYKQRGAAALSAAYNLFDASIAKFDALMVTRLDKLRGNLNLVLGGTAAAVLVVLYLFAGMLVSVLRSLKSIEAGAERLAHGDVSQAVDSYSSDELREVGGAVNSVVQTLQKFTKAQLDMARAHNEEGRVSHAMRAAEFDGRLWRHGAQPQRHG